jgi:hypothetical protein
MDKTKALKYYAVSVIVSIGLLCTMILIKGLVTDSGSNTILIKNLNRTNGFILDELRILRKERHIKCHQKKGS